MAKASDSAPSVIVWFRRDLRLQDNAALALALKHGGAVIPVYILASSETQPWAMGGASKWWLHHALLDLDAQLREKNSRLIVRRASHKQTTLDILRALLQETGASAVFWNRCYEPEAVERDTRVKQALKKEGCHVESANSSVLYEPHQIANKSGKPFQVFTPMWKHYQTLSMPAPVSVSFGKFVLPKRWPSADAIESLDLLPKISWDQGFYPFWGTPTRKAGLSELKSFIKTRAEDYPSHRDLPAEAGTSRLSPFLHFGQIGPREAWRAFASAPNHSKAFEKGIMRQLIWREFAHHLLFHFSQTPDQPLRPEFNHFPWRLDEGHLRAWQRGETGYPIVDAGMRQLWQTGWMHNRVRMIVGSLLVKHLLQPWQEGARWFWDTLVDADLANNTLGWQWIGGCGADAAPYFRIFNPITQGEKFDPDGDYVRRYVPELANVPKGFIHKPWEAGDLELKGWNVTLGVDYPSPIIDHSAGRQRALDAFAELKNKR